ncbi:MAG: hypothetical protein V1721_08100 [Pseudomonadota bacterium]
MVKKKHERLSDLVLAALNLALNQKDFAVSALLKSALEMSMTRGAGGKDFVERREFTDEVQEAMTLFDALHKASRHG